MKTKRGFVTVTLIGLMAVSTASYAGTISFSGYTWDVRPSGIGGPGPNNWTDQNVWLDGSGYLHLRLTQKGGKCYCAEVSTQQRLGFGSYQFWVTGRVDTLDPNAVLGLFNYPTPDVGPDGTNEIDIEFAKWGRASAPIGNYTVWPVDISVPRVGKSFAVSLNGDDSTHRFTWSSASVFFQSQHGHVDDNTNLIASWSYQPPDPAAHISQQPMPVHMNLWCYKGRTPKNGRQPIEIVIRAFKFTPL